MIYYVDGSKTKDEKKIIVTDNNKNVLLYKKINEDKTINELEYMAILNGLELAENNSIIYSDSKLCVEQINDNYKINKEHLKQYLESAKKIKNEKNIQICWINRDNNYAGNILETKLKTKYKNQRKKLKQTNVR